MVILKSPPLPHGRGGPWKHMRARSGYLDLVPVCLCGLPWPVWPFEATVDAKWLLCASLIGASQLLLRATWVLFPPPCWFYRYLSHLAEVTTLPWPWYSACMVSKYVHLAHGTPWSYCFWLAGISPAGPQSRWPRGLEPFKVNGPQVVGSCTPP